VVPYPAVSPRFLGFQPKRAAEFAAGNPVAWYREFLKGTTVLPHSRLFATLQTFGEVAVGLGLVRGLSPQGTSARATPHGSVPHGTRATTVFVSVSITATSFARPTVT